MSHLKMRTFGCIHSRAIVKIIQDGSLPPNLEICEFRFDVIATEHIFWLCRYLATPGILSRL